MDFEYCYERREKVIIEEMTINFIDVASLIKTKLATNRPQDIVDAKKLKEGREAGEEDET